MNVFKRWALLLCLCGSITGFVGCIESQKTVTLPPVSEDSLTPQQKEILEARRKQQAEVLRQAAAGATIDPQEFAKQKMQEVKEQQEKEKAAAGTGATEQK